MGGPQNEACQSAPHSGHLYNHALLVHSAWAERPHPSTPPACALALATPGVLLSGGLDSSLVAAVASRKMSSRKWGNKLHSFCVGLPGVWRGVGAGWALGRGRCGYGCVDVVDAGAQ